MIGRVTLRLLGLVTLTLTANQLAGAAQEAQEKGGREEPLRYVRVSVEGAQILNLADDKGIPVAKPAPGALLAVFEELEAGWVSVEAPGGFSVWVFGKYLRAVGEGDIYEVTRNAVNIRPRPASDVTNFPMPQRLHAGDRVRMIAQLEPDKPLTETWANIWSPPGVRGWLRTSATEPLGTAESGGALWGEALIVMPAVVAPVEAKSAPQVTLDEQSRKELERARGMLAEERVRPEPNFAPVRAVLEALIEDVPDGPVAGSARQELSLVGSLEEANALRIELEAVRAERAEDLRRQRADVLAAGRAKDPLGASFLARGALVRRIGSDGVPRYVLMFGGRPQGELFCTSRRYDFDMFAGFEIGVQGLDYAIGSTDLPGIDVTRIEVIARR